MLPGNLISNVNPAQAEEGGSVHRYAHHEHGRHQGDGPLQEGVLNIAAYANSTTPPGSISW